MYPVLRPLLGRGGAGRYISRAESAARLAPFAERHLRLLQTYDAALADLPAGPERDRLAAALPLARIEGGKLSETMLSLGGTPANGTGLGPAPALPGDTTTERIEALLDEERAYGEALVEEMDAVHHQERTRAILSAVAAGSEGRRGILREILGTLRARR